MTNDGAGDLSAEPLLAAQAAGERAEAFSGSTDGPDGQVARAAYRCGLVLGLMAVTKDSLVRQGAGQGSRFVLAEVAISTTVARELVFQARRSDPVGSATAAVMARDALSAAIATLVDVLDADGDAAAAPYLAAARDDLDQDRPGGPALEQVAAAMLGPGGIDLVEALP